MDTYKSDTGYHHYQSVEFRNSLIVSFNAFDLFTFQRCRLPLPTSILRSTPAEWWYDAYHDEEGYDASDEFDESDEYFDYYEYDKYYEYEEYTKYAGYVDYDDYNYWPEEAYEKPTEGR